MNNEDKGNIPDPDYSWSADNLYVPSGSTYDPNYFYYFGGSYL